LFTLSGLSNRSRRESTHAVRKLNWPSKNESPAERLNSSKRIKTMSKTKRARYTPEFKVEEDDTEEKSPQNR